ncbi:hypothetical protein SDC9_183893 [bioreactor metagenome]|uniref:Uncharacterized protein n=1 Tax=bioreactor metagenome TaxID=1076179 RepID=A0A645HJR7_9ZZZZ
MVAGGVYARGGVAERETGAAFCKLRSQDVGSEHVHEVVRLGLAGNELAEKGVSVIHAVHDVKGGKRQRSGVRLFR